MGIGIIKVGNKYYERQPIGKLGFCEGCAGFSRRGLCKQLVCYSDGEHYIFRKLTNYEVKQYLKCKKS